MIEIKILNLFLGLELHTRLQKSKQDLYFIEVDRKQRYKYWDNYMQDIINLGEKYEKVGFSTDNEEFITFLADWLSKNSEIEFEAELIDENEGLWKFDKQTFIKNVLEYDMEMRG